ncbi:MAG: hypothetical protein JST87_19165 [Bacteroidetes bacterium]|nr:hypothetical protein [Bacteroidota bacterium]MBS1932667.1 hypothetical protein [Bacteroidota bacterium]
MKHFLPLIFLCVVIASCNNGTQTSETKTDTTAKKETYTYPFTAKYSLNWQPGDEKNAVLALTSFKKYIDGDVKGSFDYFADSIEFIADKFYFKGKKDSLMAMMIPMRAAAATMSLEPDTWLTAYYPDKGDTWVTVWSLQKWTDKKGKADSVYLVDDILIKNGKIAQIDEKQREFPPAKK